MLTGQGGETLFGAITFVGGIVFVWAIARAAMAGALTRNADRQRQEGQRQP